uniref:Mariner transposase putative n=1 Tax=Albugo laibachii Nc14 TaxID=890382 RepID=F0WCU3_9STRA|nr:mariner transposase putative [Albugo laibachii Nc14]|eukprot:CCA19012.1 mariner transposase putative [Albugo laibachii Nc14]
MITKPISVDKEAYRAALIDKEDNAKPHLPPNDPDIVAAGTDGGWNIRLQCQPPNSPDFNVLYLGFFNSIQALQHQKYPKTIDELIECVTESFKELMPSTLNSVYLTLQSVLQESLKYDGGNQFKSLT